jgi:AcrR family transcriptional regulator
MSPTDAAPEVSRRDRKRRATHDQIRDGALELFTERGFADVTVADLCERAGVAQSTFFRHFATKEDVVFDEIAVRFSELPAAMAVQPVDVSPLDFILGTFDEFMAGRRTLALLATEAHLVFSAPSLQDRLQRILVEIEPAMADEIARRLPFDRNSLEVALLAAQLGVGTRVAIQLWSTQDPDVDVVDYGILMVRAWAAQADALIAARQLA